MKQHEVQKYLRSVGTDMVETAKLLDVSVTTIRNALKFPNKLSSKMWEKLELKLGEFYEL